VYLQLRGKVAKWIFDTPKLENIAIFLRMVLNISNSNIKNFNLTTLKRLTPISF